MRAVQRVRELMDEIEIIEEVVALWPEAGEHPSDELLALVRSALQSFPTSGELWYLFGMVTELWDREPGFLASDALAAYQKAIDYDPTNFEAYENLAYAYDTYFDDFLNAQKHFQRAIELGAGADSYIGLARVMAQMDQMNQALEMLAEDTCPFANEPKVIEMRREIAAGDWSTIP